MLDICINSRVVMMVPAGPHCTFFLFLLLFFSVLLPSSLALSADRKCYTGNGTITEDIPCHSKDASFCCGVGWSCLSNGLCQWRDSTSFAEGTCTDKSYPINACLGSCLASIYSSKPPVRPFIDELTSQVATKTRP